MVKTIKKYHSEMDSFLLNPGEIDESLDFASIYKNNNPVEIEIGTGKGRYLLAESLNRPQTNFLGIEYSLKWIRVAQYRLAQHPRPNCKLLCFDADFIVKLLIKPDTVSAFHVYFPDPWPKDRHQKRRLFNPRFIDKLSESLHASGKLYLKTDHQDYFRETHENIVKSGKFQVIEKNTDQMHLNHHDEASQTATHYEIKWSLESRNLFSATYLPIKE